MSSIYFNCAQVHGGITLPGGHEVGGYLGAMVNPACGVWLHVINMFTPREHLAAKNVADARWQWVLKDLGGSRGALQAGAGAHAGGRAHGILRE